MCVIVAKYLEGLGWVGAKNRDRTYKPTITIKKSFRNGVERLLMWDTDTKWTEGVNEYGIAMIGAASGNPKQMKKDEKGKKVKNESPDGKKMRNALLEKTPEKALRHLIDNKVCGNTIIFTKNTCIILESTNRQKSGYKYKTRQVPKDEVMVRTNHGIMIPTMGYQSGDDRKSSEERYEIVKKGMIEASSTEDILSALSKQNRNDPQMAPLRTSKKDGDMWTTGQIMCIPSEKSLHYRAIKSDVEFNVDKLNDESHKTKFEIISSKKLLSQANVISFGEYIQ